jgi:hypothetical protein
MGRAFRALVVSVGLVGLLFGGHKRVANADDSEYARATLRGLKGMAVFVVQLSEDVGGRVSTRQLRMG